MMKCPSCGCECEEGMKFCGSCGAKLPQVKVCPACGEEVPLQNNFCGMCGHSFVAPSERGGRSSSSPVIGDRNVIAGPVTIVNEYESGKQVTCSRCGQKLPESDSTICPQCRQVVCKACFDSAQGICSGCVSKQEEDYVALLRKCLEDGVITMSERRRLEEAQRRLGLSASRTAELERRVRMATMAADGLSPVEASALGRARELLYQDGNAEGALELLEPMVGRHGLYDSEELTSLHVEALASSDEARARQRIAEVSSRVDVLGVALADIVLDLRQDDWQHLVEADRKLGTAERKWPGSPLLSCLRAISLLRMHRITPSAGFLQRANEILAGLPEPEDKVVRSWLRRARNLLLEATLGLAAEAAAGEDLYAALVNGGRSAMDRSRLALPGDVPLDLVWIPSGSFLMGSPEDELGRFSDETQHRVTLTRDFWLGRDPVTQAQYEAVTGENPSDFQGADRPVENVSWEDAKAFCEKLNELYRDRLPKGYRFDLPTEAQWECACRAGTTTALNSGKDLIAEDEACPNLDEVGWYLKNSDETHPVGQKTPNAWGLYDMHGNVWEWCRDWYGGYEGDAVDPTGPEEGSIRVDRGGCWYYYARYCRSACRNFSGPARRYSSLGFRLALCEVQ